MNERDEHTAGGESAVARAKRLIDEGMLSPEQVNDAVWTWRRELADGVRMPNGEVALVSLGDLLHAIVDSRIARKPWRIRRALMSVYEIRTAARNRRRAMSQWGEDDKIQCGYVILDPDGHLRTIHIVDRRAIRKFQRRGELLWRQ